MKVISMFSGAGGLDLGFELAGHKIVWANDFDKNAVLTYKNNFDQFNKHDIVLGDICEYLGRPEEELKKEIPDADIVIGGFPCQGFSVANLKRNMEDQRNFLYLQILKMLNLKNPKYFLLENVKGLTNMEKGKVLEMILNDLENSGQGYEVYYNVLNALNYGVPENRERVIIYGVRKDVAKKIKLPIFKGIEGRKVLNVPPTHSSISDIEQPMKTYEVLNDMYDKLLKNIKIKQDDYFKKGVLYRYQTLNDDIKDLPEELGQENILNHEASKCKKVDENSAKTKFMGNRPTSWNKWAPTIMGRGSGTGGPLIIPHPEYNRRMSVREVARIQTFPDKFKFEGSVSAGYRQVGNAVPVLMAFNIAKIFNNK